MAKDYLEFIGADNLPPDTGNGGDDDVPLRLFERLGLDSFYKYNDAPDVWYYGELERLLKSSQGEDEKGEFTPSWDTPMNSRWYWPKEIKDLLGGSWELENKVLGKRKPHVSGLW